jgi:nucleoside-diphosphate-sugar epimerase
MVVSVLVIGGAGFVGDSITVRLLQLGYAVSCMDMVEPSKAARDFCKYCVIGSVTDAGAVSGAFRLAKPEVVIHLASFGMSGADMLDRRCWDINVTGTENIINACKEERVKLLVYTSSYNVIFGGQEIYNGKEGEGAMNYFPKEMALDQYGPTKSIAEQAVLKANGTLCGAGAGAGADASASVLWTCSVRPAAIYGEHEKRHFSRIVKHIDSGAFVFRIGSALVDWVYIDNLVSAA